MRRFLKRNHGTEAPTNLLFFDSETHAPQETRTKDEFSLSLRLWCAIALRFDKGVISRREVRHGKTVGEFWEFLYSRTSFKNPLWAFCHNAACDWSWLHLHDELRSKRLNVGPIARGPSPATGKKRKPWTGRMVMESRPSFIVARHKGATVKLVDTGNYWSESVWSIGEKFGLPKLPWPGFDAIDAVMETYCQRDCEVLEQAVTGLISWWVKEDCGTFQLTAPSLAMTNYRHTAKLLQGEADHLDIIVERNHPAHQLERRGYYGPRFEAFFDGRCDGPIWKVDVNSCYLAQMETQLFPYRRVGKLPVPTVDALWRATQAYGAVAEVRIHAQGATYPLRSPTNGAQLHVTGQFWTVLCGPELRRALEAGDVAEVGECNLYALGPIFRGWARQWHDRKIAARLRGDRAQEEFAKLIGNSLSGKWGQHGIGWRDVPGALERPECRLWVVHDTDSNETVYYRSVPGGVQRWETGEEPQHCSPIISAYISAYAREYMRGVISELPAKSVYYIGSDSLLIDDAAHQLLEAAGMLDPNTLGSFKVEGPYDSCEVRGTNCYRVGERWVRSGIHAKPKPGIRHPQCSEAWEKMPAILARGMDGQVRFKQIPWQETHPNDKGTRQADGWFMPLWLTFDPELTDRAGISVLDRACKAKRPKVPSL